MVERRVCLCIVKRGSVYGGARRSGRWCSKDMRRCHCRTAERRRSGDKGVAIAMRVERACWRRGGSNLAGRAVGIDARMCEGWRCCCG